MRLLSSSVTSRGLSSFLVVRWNSTLLKKKEDVLDGIVDQLRHLFPKLVIYILKTWSVSLLTRLLDPRNLNPLRAIRNRMIWMFLTCRLLLRTHRSIVYSS